MDALIICITRYILISFISYLVGRALMEPSKKLRIFLFFLATLIICIFFREQAANIYTVLTIGLLFKPLQESWHKGLYALSVFVALITFSSLGILFYPIDLVGRVVLIALVFICFLLIQYNGFVNDFIAKLIRFSV